MTRNQIRKQQYIIWKRLQALYPLLFNEEARKNATKEYEQAAEQAKLLHQQDEELKKKMLASRDEDEPQQEMYVPQGASGKFPLLVLLHGAGWNGGSQVEIWQSLAAREHIALFAPTSQNHEWTHPADYAALEARLTTAINTLPIDRSRIYAVGHSRGAAQALRLGRMKPEYIAALGLHSPSRDQPALHGGFPKSSRRLPVRVWAGSERELDSNRDWSELLPYHFNAHPEHNLQVDSKFLEHHRHSDYNSREGLLEEIWDFLKDKSL
ncbi:MAG TPA: alpha/beta fold hydrolase [Candidatus Angelobacter sp.]|nr:alpha/beta fold hydrolase [Candidatus Angelobacter sp.]